MFSIERWDSDAASESYKHLTAMKERNILLVNIIQMLIDKLVNLLCVCFFFRVGSGQTYLITA